MIMCAGIAATGQAQAQAPVRAQDSAICTDRPTKANSVCTVPPGAIQFEASVATSGLTEVAGTRTELLTVASTFAKIGLSDRSDLQVGVTPFSQLTFEGEESVFGFGDLLVRYKHRVTADDAPVQVAVIPFVKLPTAASGLGNERVEGGLAVPISFALARSITLTLGPELGLLADGDGRGRHLALVNLINVAIPAAPRLTIIGELWTNFNFDPAGTVEQASADAALVYAASTILQFDAGINVGLTSQTPDVEAYAGVSVRF